MMGQSQGSTKHKTANPVVSSITSSTVAIFLLGLIRIVVLQWRLDQNPPRIVDPEGFAGVLVLFFGILIVPLGAVISGAAVSQIIKNNPKQSAKENVRSATIAGDVIGTVLALIAFYIILPM